MSDQINDLDVLVLTQYYSPEPIGTAPYAADLAEWLGAQGARVEVLTNRPYYPGTVVFPEYQDGSRDRETMSGIPIVRLRPFVPKRGSVMERLRADLSFLVRGLLALIRGRVRRRHRVVSFCPSVFTVVLGWFALARGGRHVAVVHDIQSGLARGLSFPGAKLFVRALRRFEAFAMNRAHVVVVLSAAMKQQLERLGVIRQIVEIPIWVDTGVIHPLSDDPTRPPTLLYSGNLGRKQGLSMVLGLAERVARARSDVRVLIRGAGNQAASILAEARSRNLTNLGFAPLLPKDQLNEGLAEGDVHLVPQDPSAADFALPSKLFTIMAAGRPAVATARSGSALWRLAKESRAFICVLPDDLDAFAQCALDLLSNTHKQRELGVAGRQYVEEFAARQTVLNAYSRLIARGF